MVISLRQKEMNPRYLPIVGCVAVILVCIKIIREKAFQSQRPLPPPPSDPAIVPQIPDPEVVDRPSSPTISISPSCNEPRDFDIFLSFRGEDTRNGFTGHLYRALCDRSLKTFIDNKDLHRGEKIEELFRYIERSKVFVPILSKGYAGSDWCLKEIAKIVDSAQGRLIVPIFFRVEPSDVRHQVGPFKSAFESYDKDKKMDRAEVIKWRDALTTVANISGYSLKNDADGNEATLVDKVVSHLLRHLDSGLLFVAAYPVGMGSRIEDMMKKLQIERDGVKMVGIVGTGGIGKTTITKAVFNKLRSKFGAATFLPSVREYWKSPLAKIQLMRQLVEEILKDRVTPINNIETAQRLLIERVPSKKVLIVLDDVDHVDQFEVLVGESRHRFTSGSRIIITTRDESVLLQCGVKEGDVYKPKLLDNDQSLDLFKSYAFQTSCQQQDMYVDMSQKVVTFAGGLPLALKVFGSYLSDKSDLDEWQYSLGKLQRTTERDIQKRLQISYDGLYEVEKRIFLDIACFFHGHSQVEATLLWESLNWQPRSAILVLQKKSLITVREDGAFDMHDLIRDMGREVIRQAEPSKPWMWSRLWTAEDTLETLSKNRRTDVVEGINLWGTRKELSAGVFGEMANLRVLQVNFVSFKGKNFVLPEALKILSLRESKTESLSSCNLENLVALELDGADDVSPLLVRESSSKVFNALKFLKIAGPYITTTPDFSNMPHLEALELSYCTSLVEVHESIGNLTKLKYLMFLQFLHLEKLPDAICQLTSLQTLRLEQFPRLESLPERLGDLESLNELKLEGMGITSVPSSIGQLTKLRKMYLRRLDRLRSLPDSISSLNSLQVFNIDGTDLEGMKIDGVDVMDIDQLEISSSNCLSFLPASSLKKTRALCISDGTIEELPKSLELMEKIEQLSLRCKNLKSLPDWLKNLKTFEADCESLTLIINEIWSLRSLQSLSLQCANLEELPSMAGSFLDNLKSLTLGCKNLRALPGWIGSIASLRTLKLEACENIADLPLCISNLLQLEELALNGCKRIQSVPPLPSSLLVLDASNCSDLGKTLDVSNLKSLKKLCLGGCRLLEEVQGIENSARNMEELVLPGPYGSIDCSCLSDDFKKKVFKELAFERLRRFEIWGNLAPGSVTLSFMLPNGANSIRPEPRIERLVLNNVPSPIHIKLVEDDHRVIFESTFEVQRPVVTNFYRPIWIPLPRNPSQMDQALFISVPRLKGLRYVFPDPIGRSEANEVKEVAAEDGGEGDDQPLFFGVPRQTGLRYFFPDRIVRSDANEVKEVAAEDGGEGDGGHDNEAEAEGEGDRETQVTEKEDGLGRVLEWIDCHEWIHLPSRVISVSSEIHGCLFYMYMGIPCHERCAWLSLNALGRTEEFVVDEAEDGGDDGGGRDGEIGNERAHGGENQLGVYRPKIKQVFQPNRVPYFLESYPCFLYWEHERSEISSDYKVSFGKEEEEIQEHLRAASHATILVSTDTSNLTTIRMAFSFAGEDCKDAVGS